MLSSLIVVAAMLEVLPVKELSSVSLRITSFVIAAPFGLVIAHKVCHLDLTKIYNDHACNQFKLAVFC